MGDSTTGIANRLIQLQPYVQPVETNILLSPDDLPAADGNHSRVTAIF